MALYTFRELTLTVEQEAEAGGEDLGRLLEELAWTRTPLARQPPTLRLSVRRHTGALDVPASARLAFQAEGFCGFERGDECYLTDGSSLFHLQQGHGTAQLAPAFFAKSRVVRRQFWAFGVLKLLRPLGFYSLHAAGVVRADGCGVLLVGASGSGKSTLTLGVIRQGWRYLSDDAILLRWRPEGIMALACRQAVYLDAAAARNADLPLGTAVPDAHGGRKRRVHLEAAYPGQQVADYFPRVLLFPRIVPTPHSALRPLDHPRTLKHLLAASGPHLFDRATMASHLALLRQLVQQAASYELQAGGDLYRQPGTLAHLLVEVGGAG